ncbi:hypothetical protein [Saccharothrix sp.]|uniref:hypothetical protein n=1 Tax=Saccharothrix sp. TaxID=1873460 RepID=UPI002810BBF0|nr:hypothetical protein [Saccharothrix sp.]
MPLFGRRHVEVAQPKPAEEHTGPLAEYTALRAEVLFATEMMWKGTVFQVTSAGAVFGFSLSSAGRLPLLLIVPFSSYILCTRTIFYRRLIHNAKVYIHRELDGRVPGGLRFEEWRHQRSRKRQLLRPVYENPLVLMFPGISALSLGTVAVWFLRTPPKWHAAEVGGTVAWSIGAVLTLLSVALLWTAHRQIVAER